LRQETYLFLGQRNRELLDEAVRRRPDARGPEIGLIVLELLGAREVIRATDSPSRFFDRWVRERGGLPPRLRKRDKYLSGGEAAMELERLKWVGLALIVALAGGAVWSLVARQKIAADPTARTRPPRPPPPEPTRWRIAVSVFSGKLRDRSITTREAADVLAHAPYWWIGDLRSWNEMASSDFEPVSDLPDSDDALVIVVLEAVSGGPPPSSRPEAASLLRAAATGETAEVVGVFAVRDGVELPSAFRR